MYVCLRIDVCMCIVCVFVCAAVHEYKHVYALCGWLQSLKPWYISVFLIRSYGTGRCPVAHCHDKICAALVQQ